MLWNCMRVTMDGLEVFRHLQALCDLSLRGCSQLPDALCYPVAHLHALTRLDLRNCERFTGVRPVSPAALCMLRRTLCTQCSTCLETGLSCGHPTLRRVLGITESPSLIYLPNIGWSSLLQL